MRTRPESTSVSSFKSFLSHGGMQSTGTALNTEQVLGVQNPQSGRRFFGLLGCLALAVVGTYWYWSIHGKEGLKTVESTAKNGESSASSLALQRNIESTVDSQDQARTTSTKSDQIEKSSIKLSMTLSPKTSLQTGQFAVDSIELTPSTRQMLDTWARRLNRDRTIKLRIAGHADERGTNKYNENLSMKRAIAAKQYLVRKGISAARIEAAGYGKRQPLVQGNGENAWAKNRRIELRQKSKEASTKSIATPKHSDKDRARHLTKN